MSTLFAFCPSRGVTQSLSRPETLARSLVKIGVLSQYCLLSVLPATGGGGEGAEQDPGRQPRPARGPAQVTPEGHGGAGASGAC